MTQIEAFVVAIVHALFSALRGAFGLGKSAIGTATRVRVGLKDTEEKTE